MVNGWENGSVRARFLQRGGAVTGVDEGVGVPEKILVVEDEQDLRELVGKYFVDMGYQVVTTSDGGGALDVAKNEKPQIILLDLKMPELDGIEICKRLKADETTSTIPIIILTAYNNQLNEALAAGADDFVAKPVHLLELSVRIKSILKVRHLTDELEKSVAYMKELQKNLPGVDTGHWRRPAHAQAAAPKAVENNRRAKKR
jgi:two-component system alkaline phosphatase synthesis response regulator PhoP